MVERAQALVVKGDRQSQAARLLSLAAVVAGTAAFYLVLAWLRTRQHSVIWFVHLGSNYLGVAHGILGHPTPQSTLGYDGQYYYAFAVDPAHAHATMSGGNAGYVYARVLYPMLARVLAFGDVSQIPSRMLELNLLAIVAGTAALGLWLRSRGVSPLYALVFGFWPGLMFGVFRDLTEPLAFALVAVAMLVFEPARNGRVASAAGLFALALLTRETVIFFPLACAATLVRADRRVGGSWRAVRTWRRGAGFVVASVLPLLAWRQVVAVWLHLPTQERGSGLTWLVPFHGLAVQWPFDRMHWLVLATVVLPSLTLAAAVVATGTLRRHPVVSALLLANVLAFVVFLPQEVDVDFAAAARGAVAVVPAAVYVVPALLEARRGRAWAPAAAAFLSFGWYAVGAFALGLSVLGLVST